MFEKAASSIDNFKRDYIRSYVHRCYEAMKAVKISEIREHLEEGGEGKYSDTTVHRIMRGLGYRYNKNNCRSQIFERKDIVEQRRQFCKSIKKLRWLGNC